MKVATKHLVLSAALSLGFLVSSAAAEQRGAEQAAPASSGSDWDKDPRFLESQKVLQDYLDTLRETLMSGSDPRGWIVASTMLFTTSEHPRDPLLVDKAREASPNDMFVQWMVTQMNADSSPAWVAAQDNLERGEPENGAVWLNALNAAAHRSDENAVDHALEQLSRSTRFDTYAMTLANEMSIALARKPMPDIDWPPEADFPKIPAETMASLISYRLAVVMVVPATKSLTDACSLENTFSNNRRINCDVSQRLLLSKSDLFFVRSSAAHQLFDRHALTFDDNEMIRANDWVYSNWASDLGNGTAEAEARSRMIANFLQFGSEVEGMREYMQKSDIPMTAAADWTDRFAPKTKPENSALNPQRTN